VASLPDDLLGYLDNVQITVEEVPPPDPVGHGEEILLGLYQGVPRTERELGMAALPDRITLFRRPLEARARSTHDLAELVRETVVHEIALAGPPQAHDPGDRAQVLGLDLAVRCDDHPEVLEQDRRVDDGRAESRIQVQLLGGRCQEPEPFVVGEDARLRVGHQLVDLHGDVGACGRAPWCRVRPLGPCGDLDQAATPGQLLLPGSQDGLDGGPSVARRRLALEPGSLAEGQVEPALPVLEAHDRSDLDEVGDARFHVEGQTAHAAGDELLVAVAARRELRAQVSPLDGGCLPRGVAFGDLFDVK
jgi:hypothetical protein